MNNKCKIEECNKPYRRKSIGLCGMHETRLRRHGDINKVKLNVTHRGQENCSQDGCQEKHYSKGLCKRHYENHHRSYGLGRENFKKGCKKYNQSYKGRIVNRLKRQRRRHLEVNEMQLTSQDLNIIYNQFNHKCFNCGQDNDLTLDHHIPLIKGGFLTLQNTVLLCRKCTVSAVI